MGIYRKLPVEIEAKQLIFGLDSQKEIVKWCNGEIGPDGSVLINTLEGIMTASSGDYVIRGINGEFYPCKPDIFEKTYELISNK